MTEPAAAGSALPDVRTLGDLAGWPRARVPGRWQAGRCTADRVEWCDPSAFEHRVRRLAAGFETLGLRPGDRVAIMSETRLEWLLTDLAALGMGGITVPVYPTLPPPHVRHILKDSGARFVVASDAVQVDKIRQIRHQVPDVEVVVVFDGHSDDGASALPLAGLEGKGQAIVDTDAGFEGRYRSVRAAIDPEQLATIIYTSGTTGNPKGVMLSHRNLLSNVRAVGDVLAIGPEDTALSFLPLSHSFERMVIFTYLYYGVSVAFAESLDTVARDLLQVRPTLMTGVPRVYEKLHARIEQGAAAASPFRQRLFAWALGVGRAYSTARLGGGRVSPLLASQRWLADHLVFTKIRERTGGRLRYVVSGSAPLPRAIGEFFHAIGLPVIEGYGLTETSPVLTTNPEKAPRFGTVGLPIPGVELKLAPDGEILARGPNIMMGYYNLPDETAETFVDGWYRTGDVGEISADGYVTITDRKKDLIVTSGGKNVAPQPIETQMKLNRLVDEAVVIGDRRKYLVMLIVPNPEQLAARLAALGRPGGTLEDLVRRPDVQALYQELVDALNRDLAQFEQIKRMTLLPVRFGVDSGELTPSLKVRRRVVEERWRDVIDALYGGAAASDLPPIRKSSP